MFIKVTLNNNTRKLKLQDGSSLIALKTELIRAFGDKVVELSIGYLDSDNELITVANEEDWKVCLEEFADKSSGKAFITVAIQLSTEEFINVASSCVSVTHDSVEIKEEPIIPRINEDIPDGKTIIEVSPTSVFEMEEATKPSEEVLAEAAPAVTNPEVNTDNMVHDLNKVPESVFGIKVDVVDAHIDNPQEEQNELEISNLTLEQKEEIDTLIEQKLHKLLNLKKIEKPKVVNVHRGITCDGCQQLIMNGARFKSLIKSDFDLCEACEQKGLHPEPMVRFATPAAQNNWQLERKFSEFYPYFNHNGIDQSSPQFEGFRFPRPEGGCPFKRNGHFGGRGPWGRHCQESRPECSENMGENPFSSLLKRGDLSGLLSMVPDFLKNGLVSKISKENPTVPNISTSTPQRENVANPIPTHKPVNPEFQEIVKEMAALGANVDREVLEQVIRANNFKNGKEVHNFLFN